MEEPEVTPYHDEVAIYTAWLGTGPHAGSEPQRPIPPVPEGTPVAEQAADLLNNERQSLGHREPRSKPGPAFANTYLDPDHPELGVLYTGPTFEEELALKHGISLKGAQDIANAPRERVEKLRAEQEKARASETRSTESRSTSGSSQPRPSRASE